MRISRRDDFDQCGSSLHEAVGVCSDPYGIHKQRERAGFSGHTLRRQGGAASRAMLEPEHEQSDSAGEEHDVNRHAEAEHAE